MNVDYKIIIAGMVCLTVIYISLISHNQATEAMGLMLVSIIALSMGVIIPTPKIDNNKGQICIGQGC